MISERCNKNISCNRPYMYGQYVGSKFGDYQFEVSIQNLIIAKNKGKKQLE